MISDMFTQPCFIRKNTPELCMKLERLGYKRNSPMWTQNCGIIWCYQYSKERGFDTPYYVIANAFDIPFDKESSLCGKFIDCGTNESLFLAIASLRDDTDKHQWFVHKSKSHWWFCTDFDSFKEDYESSNEDAELKFEDWHKATIEELIEHFKDI